MHWSFGQIITLLNTGVWRRRVASLCVCVRSIHRRRRDIRSNEVSDDLNELADVFMHRMTGQRSGKGYVCKAQDLELWLDFQGRRVDISVSIRQREGGEKVGTAHDGSSAACEGGGHDSAWSRGCR